MTSGRETAWRVFAGEFNDAEHSYKDDGERSPNYVVSPLGARMNRVFTVGVLTSTETVGEGGDLLRGQVTDPTGAFYLYAGQYSPEAANALEELQPPTVVAVVGKARTYEPEEEGDVYTSIRPEVLREVDVDARDRWILETTRRTKDRLQAVEAAVDEGPEALEDHDLPAALQDGVRRALDHYGEPTLERYADMAKDAVESLLPGETELRRDFAPASDWEGDEEEPAEESPADEADGEGEEDDEEESTEIEDAVYGFVTDIDDGDGAPWEEIVSAAEEEEITEEEVEEALNSLMDRGLIYEPVLGRLKPT